MEINLTIIVQAFNFLIICIILKKLLFDPALKALDTEERERQSLSAGIEKQKFLLDENITFKQKSWRKCQIYFRQQCPKIKPVTLFAFKEISEQPELEELSAKEREYLVKHMQEALVERIANVPK